MLALISILLSNNLLLEFENSSVEVSSPCSFLCYVGHTYALCFLSFFCIYIASGTSLHISVALSLGYFIWILKPDSFTLSCWQHPAEKSVPSVFSSLGWHHWSALQEKEVLIPDTERNFMNWRAGVWPARPKTGLTKLGHLCLFLLH